MLQLYAIERTDRVTIVHPREHRVTLIWLHGLDQPRQLHLPAILEVLEGHLEHVKIVVPSAPQRLVTIMKKEASSWFDVKFRSNQSFKVPFDEAFSSVEVQHSYEEILKPIIEAERKILDGLTARGRLVVAGFSQGCGMSLHCLYSNPKGVDAALGIAGYFFSITKFSQLTNETYVIHGLADTLRPWSICKETYEGKIIEERIRLVQGMGHEITDNTKKCMKEILCALLLIG